MVDVSKKSGWYTHPLDDDGFIDNFLKELTELSNKYGVIIETELGDKLFLDVKVNEDNYIVGEYTFEYDYKHKKYV